jgi:predicted permease
MTFRDFTLRVRALLSPQRVERDLNDELAFHLERETRKHIDNGVDPEAARRLARARFGSAALAADNCRDVRGLAFIESTMRDVQYALRGFRRAPLSALTIVGTVALGLGLVAVVFSFLNVFLFRVDQVVRPGELFGVERPRLANDQAVPFTWPEYDALRRETSVFSDAFAWSEGIDGRIDGRMVSSTAVSGNFFEVLGVAAARGRTLTPADDQRFAGRPVIVLSHRGWTRTFASDPTILGRSVLINRLAFEVVGVMPEGFRGLAVGAPDYWAPLSLIGQLRPGHAGRDDLVGIGIVGRLKPGVSSEAAAAALTIWNTARTEAATRDRRPAPIILEPRQGTVPHPVEALVLFTPIFFAFGLILLIGCANVANLLLARGMSRQRELGLRLSLGASRRRIVRQLLTESLLLALVAAVLGFAVSRLVLVGTVRAVMGTMAPEIADNVRLSAPAADWRVWVFLFLGAMASTMFFGLAPALQATRLELVRTLRGDIARDARPGRTRNVLIGVQVTASALLLICAGVFLRSALAAAVVDPGLRTSDTVIVQIINEPVRKAMVDAVIAEPLVAAVAASRPGVLGQPQTLFAEAPGGRSSIVCRFVSPEYFDVLGITIVHGRGFTPAEALGTTPVAIVSESMARRLFPKGPAIGQTFQLEADASSQTPRSETPALPGRTFTLVGIARDVPGFRFAEAEETGVYVPTSAAQAETALIVRVHGDPEQARRALLQRLTAIDPNMGQVVTMRTVAQMEAWLLRLAFWLTLALGGLALVLTVSGLFSVLSYLVEQRRTEIGVHMALGATARSVGWLVLSQSLRPVAIGLVAGGSMAVGLGMALMATPAAAQIGAIVRLFDPVAYAVSLVCIVSACAAAALVPARRATRIDPVVALRQD